MGATAARRAGGGRLARNTIYNFAGLGIPMVVALVAIPALVHGLGTERFGVLALAWMVIGYFGLFDLGLGRALTQVVAARTGAGIDDDVPEVVWTALLLMVVLGGVGMLLLAAASPWLVGGLLAIPQALHEESLHAFYLLAASLPWVISTSGLRGVLEARQCFGVLNAIRVPMGLFTYLGPLAMLPLSNSLVPVVAVLVVGRVIAWAAHLWYVLREFPELRHRAMFRRGMVVPLLRSGGWMTVSNVVSPLMVYLDRFLLGAMLSMAAVAYYVTPYEIVTRLWVVPAALLGVFFPAFASTHARDPRHLAVLFDRAVRVVLLVLFPVTVVLVAFAEEGLRFWLGVEFATNGTRVLQWLAVGVFINSAAHVAFAVLQGAGRPDLTGKLHLLELVPYLVTLWALVRLFGVEGAAIAWTARVTVDTILLFILSERFVPAGISVTRRSALLMAPALLVLALLALLPDLLDRGIVAGAALLLGLPLAWNRALSAGERSRIRAFFAARRAEAKSS